MSKFAAIFAFFIFAVVTAKHHPRPQLNDYDSDFLDWLDDDYNYDLYDDSYEYDYRSDNAYDHGDYYDLHDFMSKEWDTEDDLDDDPDWLPPVAEDHDRSKRAARPQRNRRPHQGQRQQNRWVNKFCSTDETGEVDEIPERLQRRLAKLSEEQRQQLTEQHTQKRQQLRQCCDVDETERAQCFDNVRTSTFTNVCSGEEEMTPKRFVDNMDEIKTKCCSPEEADNIAKCFIMEIRREKKAGKHERREGRQNKRQNRKQNGRSSGSDCCSAGETYGTDLAGEGNATACEEGSKSFEIPDSARAGMCRKVFYKCCLRSAGLFNRRTWRQDRKASRG
jgi:hypothetical protein